MTAENLGGVLREWAEACPHKACIRMCDGDESIDYASLHQQATQLARQLLTRGCRQGARIVIGFGNSIEFFVALFACFREGFIAVPIDPALARGEIQVLLDHAQPQLIIVDAESAAAFDAVDVTCAVLTLRQVLAVSGRELGEAEVPSSIAGAVALDTPALLLYTSGTTGEPKGVLHSHGTVLSRLESIRQWFEFDSSFVALCLLPTHFGHGLICVCLNTLACGGTLILAQPFNMSLVSRLWAIVQRHGINTFSAVPTVARLLVGHAKRKAASIPDSLRFVTCASAPLTAQDIQAFETAFGVPLLNCYGLTETAGWSTCSPRTGSVVRDSSAAVGKAINGQIRVVDTEGRLLGPGQPGELQVKGPSVMLGYFRNETLTAATMADGWFATGDLGEVDEHAAVFLHSRIKELIIRAGKNIFPAEVDRVLMSHPEVAEACTVGLPDELLGETVAACVVRSESSALDQQQLIEFSRTRLAAYKCPQRILFVAGIPKTSRGKINRNAMRSAFSAGEIHP